MHLPGDGEVEAEERVERERQKDAEELDHPQERHRSEIHPLVRGAALHRAGVRPEMFDQKHADGDDARERVQLPKKEGALGLFISGLAV